MSQKQTGSTRNKAVTVVLILAVAIISIAFGYWIGTFSPRRVQKIYFVSFQWSDEGCMLSIVNTGSDELIIDRIWINGTLIDSTQWECFPSILFEPGDQGDLYMAPSSMTFTEGTAYEFTVATVAGNSFCHIAIAESGFDFDEEDSVMDRLKEKLSFEDISYDTPSGNLTVLLLNCGTIDNVTIKTVYIYDSSSALIQVFSNPPLYSFQGWDEIQDLDIQDEGRLVLSVPDLPSGFYNIKVVTVRGATFDTDFAA